MNLHRNYQPTRPTPRWLTIVQTLILAILVAGFTVAFTLELAK